MVFIQQSHLAMGVVSGSFLLSPNFDPAIISDVSRERLGRVTKMYPENIDFVWVCHPIFIHLELTLVNISYIYIFHCWQSISPLISIGMPMFVSHSWWVPPSVNHHFVSYFHLWWSISVLISTISLLYWGKSLLIFQMIGGLRFSSWLMAFWWSNSPFLTINQIWNIYPSIDIYISIESQFIDGIHPYPMWQIARLWALRAQPVACAGGRRLHRLALHAGTCGSTLPFSGGPSIWVDGVCGYT